MPVLVATRSTPTRRHRRPALREAGAEQVWLAGKAETDGVDGYLYAGCDALDVLRRTLDTLGVQ